MPTPQCMINCIFCDTSFSLLHESAAVRDVSEIESHLICALSGRSDVVAALCEAAHVAAEVNVPRIICTEFELAALELDCAGPHE